MGDYYIVPILIAIAVYIYCSVGLKKLQNPKPPKAPVPNYHPLPITPPMKYYAPGADIFPEPPEMESEPSETISGEELEEFLLNEFKIDVEVIETTQSPSLDIHHLRLNKMTDLGTKMNRALEGMKARYNLPFSQMSSRIGDIAIAAPREDKQFVYLRDVMDTPEFEELADNPDAIPAVIGIDENNNPVCIDLTKAPHFLVAGVTGSGKSVCANSMLLSALASRTPDQLEVVLIDVKQVEMAPYNGLPHLKTMTFAPFGSVGMEGAYRVKQVFTEPGDAETALQSIINTMQYRYAEAKRLGVRKLGKEYPHILVIIDEMADLMLSPAFGKSIENKIVRIAQLARAAKIHLVCCTQLPNVKVLTGLIRANMPCRMVFHCSTATDSRVSLGRSGAENFLGNGDGVISQPDKGEIRIQAAYSDEYDVAALVEYYLESGEPYTNGI